MQTTNYNIPKEKFQFANKSDISHDKKLDTKPRSYLQDAFRRFCKNKGSVVAGVIIILMLLFAIIVPFCTPYTVGYTDEVYMRTLPKSKLFAGTSFWDGCEKMTANKATFDYYDLMGKETGHLAVKNNEFTVSGGMYDFRLDSYHQDGCKYRNITADEYESIKAYQDEYKVQVLYPVVASGDRPSTQLVGTDYISNYYYKIRKVGLNGVEVVRDGNGNIQKIYKSHAKGEARPDNYDSLRIEEPEGVEYEYALVKDTGWEVRINYYEYYIYRHTYVLKDGITEPSFLFGTTAEGGDILTHLASGARFSFIFALAVAAVNLVVGAIYGAVAGYYGGKADLIMERISDILSAIPTVIVITLLKLHMGTSSQMLVLFVAFFLTGWIGMAGTTRMQFYRYKNQEYVLAARTLGAKDRRLMWKHIFPNSLGTLVTSCALVIPSMIYSEVNLSYLGILSLSSGSLTSVGTLLANGQPYIMTAPHIIFFPSFFLALLMLSFNLFGNGLRDAFNPSLRGSEG